MYRKAASKLYSFLKDKPWFKTVGIADGVTNRCLFLYVKDAEQAYKDFNRSYWMDYPVKIRKF